MAQDIRVNMEQVLCLSHTFHLVLGAGRAALLPFLALYLRLLGLSATQTGLVFGVRAFMTMICAPAWTTCAKRCNKKKLVLMLSIFVMLATHLGICLVPSADQNIPLATCQLTLKNGSSDLGPTFMKVNTSENVTSVTLSMDASRMLTSVTVRSVSTSKSVERGKGREQSVSTTASSTTSPTTTSPTTTSPTTKLSTTTTTPTTTSTRSSKYNRGNTYTDTDTNVNANAKSSSRKKTGIFSDLTSEQVHLIRSFGISPGDLESLSSKELDELIDRLSSAGDSRQRRSVLDSVLNKWKQIQGNFNLAEYQPFVFILLLFVIGELFAAPYEKLADDIWFEYLDILDALERYGAHRIWRTVGYVIVPTMVAAAVDHTPCTLPFGVHHFFIHFLIFAVFVAITFMLALCYPVSQFKQTAKKSRLAKGVRVLCADRRAYTMAMTMVVVGATSAVVSNFLFWRVQDLGGPELAMGVSVAAAAGAEFILRLIGPSVVKWLKPMWAVCLGLLLLAGLLVFYSFLWSPWLVVPGELIHGVALTLLWTAVQTYPEFRINPFVMDRSAASLVTALHVGVGFAGGSMVSGFVYDKLGPMIMFLGAAGVVVLWGILFLLVHLVGKKEKKVRYAKLLQDERDDDSDESPVYDDDWLEVAMKRDR